MKSDDTIKRVSAVEAAIEQAGGIKTCARLLRVSERLLYRWLARGHLRGVAAERVLLLEHRSGISAEHLVGLKRSRGTAACAHP